MNCQYLERMELSMSFCLTAPTSREYLGPVMRRKYSCAADR